LSLTPQELISIIINIFLTEMSMIISGYKGYVLKYKGDAVIGIFPVDFDSQKACISSIMCAKNYDKYYLPGF
jgi:adenylate cyclase